eukprot:TRINITY_DN5088_c0_g1_i3.p1 TRINITY_DN5088_c0_g1~~TRINITY_DN5088_c0_g1_i3.p1  ORF type:complete len:343 (-),score=66.98 TRINITY_DN5088_c0_g1_i3:114-1142(-)
MGKAGSKSCYFDGIDVPFDLGRVIGKGAFGKVYAVTRTDTKEMFAMKLLDKRDLLNKKMVDKVMMERVILSQVEHPLVVNLRGSWQNEKELCMLLDLMVGGDLEFHLNREKKFDEERSKLYAAQLLCGVEYLHAHKIIHRDIKPANILLCDKGNAHLTDFNVSKKFTDDQELVGCFGVSGTLNYMAPELVSKEPYSFSVDIYGIGAVTYEFLTGKCPFTSGSNQEGRMVAIKKGEVKYPSSLSADAIDFLKKTICPQKKRMSIEEAKAHPWFSNLDMEKVARKEVTCTFIPPRRANCSGSHDLEEQFDGGFDKKKKKPLTEDEQERFESWNFLPEGLIRPTD